MVDDTVLMAGSGWPRWPREVLLAGLRGVFQLVLSPYVIRQAHRNLSKRFPEHLERFEEFLSQVNFELAPDPSPEEVTQHEGLVRDESDIPIVGLDKQRAGGDQTQRVVRSWREVNKEV
jgi:hypothetical protein